MMAERRCRHDFARCNVRVVLPPVEVRFHTGSNQLKVRGAGRQVYGARIKARYTDNGPAPGAVQRGFEGQPRRTKQGACIVQLEAPQQAQVAMGYAALAPGVYLIALQHTHQPARKAAHEPAVGAVRQQRFQRTPQYASRSAGSSEFGSVFPRSCKLSVGFEPFGIYATLHAGKIPLARLI